jgi:hypothetical protein
VVVATEMLGQLPVLLVVLVAVVVGKLVLQLAVLEPLGKVTLEEMVQLVLIMALAVVVVLVMLVQMDLEHLLEQGG